MIRTRDIRAAAEGLNAGGVALIPTDTVFGLAARPDIAGAVRRIFVLKNRPPTMNLPILASSRAAIAALGAVVTPAAEALLASALMPGAVSLVLGLDPARAPAWLAGREECAVRIPNDRRILQLLEMTGPLLATSANLHGAGNIRDADALLTQLHGQPDIVLEGMVTSDIASTIVNCRIDPYRIERVGRVAAQDIAEVLRHVR